MFNKLFLVFSVLATVLISIFSVNSAWDIWIIPVSFILSYLACLILLVLSLVIFTARISKDKEYGYSKFYHYYFAYVLEYICNVSRVKVEVKGLEKIPNDKKFMLVINHRSRFDPMILFYVLKKYPVSFISKPSNFKIPFGGKLMARNGFISINREDTREGLKAINKAIEEVKSNEFCVGVFPEGTRNLNTSELLPFRNGCFKIAQRGEVPIVVVTMEGTELVKSRAPWRSTRVRINVVDVFEGKDYTSTNEISIRVKEKMEKELRHE